MMETNWGSLQRIMEIAELRSKGIQDTHFLDWTFQIAEDNPYVQMAKRYADQWEQAKAENLGLLVEIDERIRAKGPGYQRWATAYNLKQMAKTRIFLKEQGIGSIEELREKADTNAFEFDRIAKDLKAAEQRLVEIAALKKHIVNYAKTRDAYIAYRKAGYSKTFFEAHREEITLHKAAKDAFEKKNASKLPKVKALSEKYASTLTQKMALYALRQFNQK